MKLWIKIFMILFGLAILVDCGIFLIQNFGKTLSLIGGLAYLAEIFVGISLLFFGNKIDNNGEDNNEN